VTLCQLGIPMDTVLAAARQTDGIFCLNAAPAKPLPQALLNRTDILIVNESEHQVFGGQLDGSRGTCVVTLGSKGAAAIRDEQIRDPIPTPRRLQRHPAAFTTDSDSLNRRSRFTIVDIDRRHHDAVTVERHNLRTSAMEVNTHVT
jgi:hypothetical protein